MAAIAASLFLCAVEATQPSLEGKMDNIVVAVMTGEHHSIVESFAFDPVQKWMASRESGVFAFAVDGADELVAVHCDDEGDRASGSEVRQRGAGARARAL